MGRTDGTRRSLGALLAVAALGAVACSSGSGDDAGTGSTVALEGAAPTGASFPPSTERVEFPTGAGPADAVAFRAVLAVDAGGAEPSYELGPVTLDGRGVERAVAVTDMSGQWVVNVVLTEDGIVTFNELASECYAGSTACPSRQVAIEVDGEVLSAPTIQTPSFERDRIQVSGDFTRAEAEEVARTVSAAAGGS